MPTARDADKTHDGWRFSALGFSISVPWNALIGIIIIAVLWYPEFSGSFGAAWTWVLAAVFGLLLMVSILVHELAHAISARGFGYDVTGVTLWAMGGYTTYRTSERHGPGKEAVIAAAGPISTLLIAGVAWVLANAASPGTVLESMLWAIASANLLIGIFNLLPGSPLDGGAVVKSAIWAVTGSETKGQVISAWVGRVLAALLAVSPFVLAAMLGGQPSLPLIVISLMLAVILWTGASSALKSAKANEELGALDPREIARPFITVSGSATLDQISNRQTLEGFVVAMDEQGTPIGVMNPAAAAAVPEGQRDRLTVMSVSARIETLATVSADGTAKDVLRVCQDLESRYVFVIDANGPVGLIDTDAAFVAEGP